MKNKRRITGIVAAMLLATIGTMALVGYVQSAKDKAVADEALVDVYVVDKLVPKGADAETIKSSVSLEHIPARLEAVGRDHRPRGGGRQRGRHRPPAR